MKQPILSTLGLALLGTLAASAVPARPGQTLTYTQPDGTTIQVSLRGDENFHFYLDTDGRMLLPDDEGFLHLADTAGLDAARRRAAAWRTPQHGLFPDATYPNTGTQKALVILVEYQDVKFKFADPEDYFWRMLNEEGFSDLFGTGSARDFFVQNSSGQFVPDFDLYGPVTLPEDMAWYGGNFFGQIDSRPWDMVTQACAMLEDEVDFSQYDRDGDGVIDNVFIFYAGRGEASGGASSSVWPHSGNISELEPDRLYTVDGLRLDRYACTNEWHVDEDLGARPDGIGTFVHEFSHVMGLPDLYATTYNESFTPGAYSAMDYGPYNNGGCTPPNFSAWERYALGWLQPDRLPEDGEVVLDEISTGRAFILESGDDNEYFLLENRQQTGWDKFIPGHGMLVWHIHYDEMKWQTNSVNNTWNHQNVDIIEADGTQSEASRRGDTFPGFRNVTELSATTSPALRTWNGVGLPVTLSDIREIDGKILFSSTDTSGIGRTTVDEGQRQYFTPDGLRVANPGKGLYICRHADGRTSKIIF